MAKWRIETEVYPDFGPAGDLPEAGYVKLNLVGITDEGAPIPGRHIVGLPLLYSDVTTALSTGTNQQKIVALKALIRAQLPDNWEEDIIIGYEYAIDAAAEFNSFVKDTLRMSFPLDFQL